ncbi:ATP-binding cassette domain-containing protein [Guyparkeria sp. SCN-R1]|uniref:ABC transporter ATP-binding protein n=1 Tax=unclassified Guyparkeria TaxID=2626246 RepID=UPI00195B340D|nr:ATP-binding cassette domain-containing protein [Guyparkeria sp. SCN-R1]
MLFEVRGLCGPNVPPVSFALAAGEVLPVRGESGVGKSQMLRALADLSPHEGEISLEGVEQQSMPATDWRRQVALVPAESGWWADTVAEHFPARPSEAWWERLRLRAALWDSPVERLSSGERQRLAVLRALALEPRVLLLDEPTANLDRDNAEAMAGLLLDYLRDQGAAAVWISHDPREIDAHGDRWLEMTSEGGVLHGSV